MADLKVFRQVVGNGRIRETIYDVVSGCLRTYIMDSSTYYYEPTSVRKKSGDEAKALYQQLVEAAQVRDGSVTMCHEVLERGIDPAARERLSENAKGAKKPGKPGRPRKPGKIEAPEKPGKPMKANTDGHRQTRTGTDGHRQTRTEPDVNGVKYLAQLRAPVPFKTLLDMERFILSMGYTADQVMTKVVGDYMMLWVR